MISASLVAELKLPLAKTRVQIKPYGTNKHLRAVGYYVGPIRYKYIVANVGMYVVKGEVETLLSGKASEALRILTFHGEEKENWLRRSTLVEDPEGEFIMKQYPGVFKGVGKLHDYQVTLHVDNDIPPVALPPRQVPFHLWARLDKEIQAMEEALKTMKVLLHGYPTLYWLRRMMEALE